MSIEVKNLFHIYNKKSPIRVNALNGVSLSIKPNTISAIIGETGSGKSTLVQHLNGLLIPNEGEVIVDDFVIRNKKNKRLKELRRHVGLVFQFPEYQLFEETVIKDVMFGPKNFGLKVDEAKELAIDALKKVNIDESYYERSPFELSGGEKRRIAIAGILALKPDILVFDEPTAGLDYDGVKAFIDLVKSLKEEGKTIVIVSHDMDFVLRYVDEVFLLEDGKLSFNGTPQELFNCPSSVDIPKLYELARKLNEKGFEIELKNLRRVHALVDMIKGDLHK